MHYIINTQKGYATFYIKPPLIRKPFMMNKILLLCLSVLLCACSADSNEDIVPDLDGTWNLQAVLCYCDNNTNTTYTESWNFNTANGTVTVTTNTEEESFSFLPAGMYDMQVTDDTLTINETTYEYYFENGWLFLNDDLAADGTQLAFSR